MEGGGVDEARSDLQIALLTVCLLTGLFADLFPSR